MEIQVLDDPKEVQAETQAVALRAEVDALNVVDQASYDLANVYNKQAYEKKADFHKWDDPVHAPIVEAWQKSCARRKVIDNACDYVIKITAKATGEYIAAQKAKALEEQRKAEKIARKDAEDAALVTAQALQDEGLEAQAEAVLEAPVVVQRVEVAAPAMDSGTSLRTYYSAEVKDLLALVKSVAEGKTPLFYIMADQSKLDGWARLSKGAEAIAGVEVKIEHKQSRML